MYSGGPPAGTTGSARNSRQPPGMISLAEPQRILQEETEKVRREAAEEIAKLKEQLKEAAMAAAAASAAVPAATAAASSATVTATASVKDKRNNANRDATDTGTAASTITDAAEPRPSKPSKRRKKSMRASAAKGVGFIRKTMREEARVEAQEERARELREKKAARERRTNPCHKLGETGPSETHRMKWEKHFEELKAFKAEHGHCNVPSGSSYGRLGTWVSDQRTHHRFLREGKRSYLTPERIQKLTSIGFSWTVRTVEPVSWDLRFAQLAEYKTRHGHCNIAQYCRDPMTPSGLGAWAHEQRRFYKRSKRPESLTQQRIEALEALGFKWKLRNRGGGGGGGVSAAAASSPASVSACSNDPTGSVNTVEPPAISMLIKQTEESADIPDMMYMEA